MLAGFRQITDLPGVESFPSLAPDGVTLLFDSAFAGNQDVYVQRVDGQRPINLTESSPDDDRMAAFSPDGTTIAFRSEREGGGLFVMGATGESARRLTTDGYHPAWTPDGREVVYSTGAVLGPQTVPESELWAVEVATGHRRRLPGAARAVQPSVSPHGRRVVYWTSIAGQRDLASVPLAAVGEPRGPDSAHRRRRHRLGSGLVDRRPVDLLRERPRRRCPPLAAADRRSQRLRARNGAVAGGRGSRFRDR